MSPSCDPGTSWEFRTMTGNRQMAQMLTDKHSPIRMRDGTWRIIPVAGAGTWCFFPVHELMTITYSMVVWNIFYFPIYWVANHPKWLSYFSEGWPNHQPAYNYYPPKWDDPPRSQHGIESLQEWSDGHGTEKWALMDPSIRSQGELFRSADQNW